MKNTTTSINNSAQKRTVSDDTIPKEMNLRIRVLHAIDYPEIAMNCHKKHLEVLDEFNLSNEIDSAKSNWWDNPNSYLLIVEDIYSGEIGSSIRIDMIAKSHPLPLASILRGYDSSFVKKLEDSKHILGELSGLWVSQKFSKRRLSTFLLDAILALSSKLRINYLIAMPPKHTKYVFDQKGFEVVKRIGNKGEIFYPNDSYISTIMEFNDTFFLKNLVDRTHIISLRQNPVQKVNYIIDDRKTILEYDLRIL